MKKHVLSAIILLVAAPVFANQTINLSHLFSFADLKSGYNCISVTSFPNSIADEFDNLHIEINSSRFIDYLVEENNEIDKKRVSLRIQGKNQGLFYWGHEIKFSDVLISKGKIINFHLLCKESSTIKQKNIKEIER